MFQNSFIILLQSKILKHGHLQADTITLREIQQNTLH